MTRQFIRIFFVFVALFIAYETVVMLFPTAANAALKVESDHVFAAQIDSSYLTLIGSMLGFVLIVAVLIIESVKFNSQQRKLTPAIPEASYFQKLINGETSADTVLRNFLSNNAYLSAFDRKRLKALPTKPDENSDDVDAKKAFLSEHRWIATLRAALFYQLCEVFKSAKSTDDRNRQAYAGLLKAAGEISKEQNAIAQQHDAGYSALLKEIAAPHEGKGK